ncbi:hypothetical protein LINPERPRIM_LOCUS26902 [Linum perenne]
MIIDLESNVTGARSVLQTTREPSLVIIRPSSPKLNRRNSFLPPPRHRRGFSTSEASSCSGRFGELAGGTTAECVSIACCCPCGIANLLFLTIYKVPVGLCRKALRRKRRQHLMKKGVLIPRRQCQCGCDDAEFQIHPIHGGRSHSFDVNMMRDVFDDDEDVEGKQGEEEMMRLEKEMWDTFYETGFWRSPSQREPVAGDDREATTAKEL